MRDAERTTGRRRGGFTFLEVLVSLAILSATLLLAYRVASSALSAQERSERWLAASALGEEMLREETDRFPEVQETEGTFPPPNEAYSWKRTVRQALHADAREVHVAVTWKSGEAEETVLLSGIAGK